MHLVIANMSARYSGRGETYLAPYDRILLIKADGAVAIHGDKGHKPLNYMMSTAEKIETVKDGERVWTFDSRTESLSIYFHEVYSEFNLDFGSDEPGLTRDGTEAMLQEWLSGHLHKIAPDLRFVDREYQTGDGPVDILARSKKNDLVAIEVKRVAPMNTVGQVLRYMDALREKHPGELVEGVIAAVELKAKTIELAKKRGVRCIEIPEDWNTTPILAPPEPRDLTAGTLFALLDSES